MIISFEVVILKDNKARDDNGRTYYINGIEIRRDRGFHSFYPITHDFYKKAAQPGTRSKAYLLPSSKINLL